MPDEELPPLIPGMPTPGGVGSGDEPLPGTPDLSQLAAQQGAMGQVPMPGMPMGAAAGGQMASMMQMMQMMMSGMAPMVDPAAAPFSAGPFDALPEEPGLDGDIIQPALLPDLLKEQRALPTGSVLDYLCLTRDSQYALGGLPMGCTIAFAGPPGKGKTRTALAALSRIAAGGEKVAFVVAEEGFYNDAEAGRDDLCSRLMRIGMDVTGLDKEPFIQTAVRNMFVLESQYHRGQTWDDFVAKYRYLVERERIRFAVIDSLNMLDPTRHRTADNLAALKTYNHEQGITCICVGQILDSGAPVGGEALQHTADVVYLLEEYTLSSKAIAEQWGGNYRDRIDVIRVIKSVTTPTFPHRVRVARSATGELLPHPSQPAEFAVKPLAPADG